MKRSLRVAGFVISLCTGTAVQAGDLLPYWGGGIGIYSDPAGWCICLDAAPQQIYSVYIVHKDGVGGASLVQFRMTTSWSGFDVSVTYNGLTLGDIFNGVAVAYIGCKSYPFVVATVTLHSVAPIPEATRLQIEADPNVASGEVEVLDCNSTLSAAVGGFLVINAPNCFSAPQSGCQPVSSEPSTWGRVKSLYH